MLIDAYQFQTVRILQVHREAEKAVGVHLELPSGYDFAPGQHAVVRVSVDGILLTRQYSFSSIASSGELWLTVVETPGGAVSSWFNQRAKAGDMVEVSKPFSGPLMQNCIRGNVCIIAGGSGIAPLIAHVRELRKNQQSFTLFYSTRTAERCFENELAPQGDGRIIVRLTDKEPRLISSDITPSLTPSTTVLVCGSRQFALNMRAVAETIVPKSRVYAEAFTLT